MVGRRRLGPFAPARLTATGPGALDGRLHSNGFPLPPRLDTALRPYAERRWEYVAVRLARKTAGFALAGALDPLHLAFASDRPSPGAAVRARGHPVVAGPARARGAPRGAARGDRRRPPRVLFAGRLSRPAGGLRGLAAGAPYLTAVGQEFPYPSRISDDHVLRRASSDTPFQQAVHEDRLREAAGVPLWLLTAGAALPAVTAGSLPAIRHSRRPVLPPPPMPPPARPGEPIG